MLYNCCLLVFVYVWDVYIFVCVYFVVDVGFLVVIYSNIVFFYFVFMFFKVDVGEWISKLSGIVF